jgi:hypothetical protein
MKQCKVCGLNKPLTDYYKNHGKCKPCYLEILRTKRVPGDKREYNLRYSYGIGEEDYNNLLLSQGNCCAICGSEDPKGRRSGRGGGANRMCVDHCHTTNKVRGLLCHACNRALGNFGDDISNLQRAIEYLQRNQQ